MFCNKIAAVKSGFVQNRGRWLNGVRRLLIGLTKCRFLPKLYAHRKHQQNGVIFSKTANPSVYGKSSHR